MTISKIVLTFIVLLLLAGNVFLGFQYFSAKNKLDQTEKALSVPKFNEKILSFFKLFIEKVLKADKEIDFESRLALENAVRNLNDKEILSQWQKFIESREEIEAQREVKNLLELLAEKIKI